MEPTFTPPAPTHSRRGPLTALIGVILLVGLFAVGLMPKLHNDEKLTAAAKDVATEVPQVEVVHPHFAPAEPLLLPGSIEALSETAVQARASGYVRKMYVDIGSHVKTGQVLADIESPDTDQLAAQAVADEAKSRATVGQSVADVARLEAGVTQSQADLIRQRAAILQAQAASAGARSKLAQAKADVAQAQAKYAQSKQDVDVQKSVLAQAQAQYELAAATVKRYEGLLKAGFVAQQDYEQAVATFKTTAATISSAKASIGASESNVNAAEQTVKAESALVHSAESDVEAADENVAAARAQYRSLVATVSAAKSSVAASRANVTASLGAVNSSQANTRRYAVISSFEHVVAPFDGIITARNVDIGSLVSPGAITATSNGTTPVVGLFGIARDDTLRIYINVPQSDFGRIRTGMKAKVLIQEMPNATFDGTVFQAAGALNEATRTLLTEIRLPNPKGILMPGMYAQVRIDPIDKHGSLQVPASTLIVDAKGTRVAVVGPDDRVHYRTIGLGRDYGAQTEILSGVGPNDRLISNPSDELHDGDKVEILTK